MKKWFIVICTFVFVFAFGVTAFASTSYPNLPVTGSNVHYVIFNDNSMTIWDSSSYVKYGVGKDKDGDSLYGALDSSGNLILGKYYELKNGSWVYQFNTYGGGNRTVLFSNVGLGSPANFQTPLTAQTTRVAIQGLQTAFSSNSKVILTVGVLILGTLLGVSLIPRLIRSFR